MLYENQEPNLIFSHLVCGHVRIQCFDLQTTYTHTYTLAHIIPYSAYLISHFTWCIESEQSTIFVVFIQFNWRYFEWGEGTEREREKTWWTVCSLNTETHWYVLRCHKVKYTVVNMYQFRATLISLHGCYKGIPCTTMLNMCVSHFPLPFSLFLSAELGARWNPEWWTAKFTFFLSLSF